MRGPGETILKAQLSPDPSSARAVTGLLESLALWEGIPVRAALVVDESSTSSCLTTRYRELFSVLGDSNLLYQLEWVPRVARHRRRDDLRGLGNLGDLERLLARVFAR
jgi:hypothetical protein